MAEPLPEYKNLSPSELETADHYAETGNNAGLRQMREVSASRERQLMGKQEIVIDCNGDGSVEAMHFDQFPLGFLGRMNVQRASEIFHNPKTQLWDILLPGQAAPIESAMGFSGYDVARRFEVEWLQECRKRGVEPDSLDGSVVCLELRNLADRRSQGRS